MDKGRNILEAIVLLQKFGEKPKKLPIWHYALDYFLTAVFLSAYAFGIIKLITFML